LSAGSRCSRCVDEEADRNSSNRAKIGQNRYMAWDPLPRLGACDGDEYGGDLPMDAFGASLHAASEAFQQAAGRRPYTSELAEAMARAMANATDIGAREQSDARLARWLAMPRIGGGKRPRVAAGDIVRIPYAMDGARHIYARVLFVPSRGKQARRGPGLGSCWVVHDLDAPSRGEIDPATVRSAPLLMGPFHIGNDEVSAGRWRVVGRVEPDDAELPTFGSLLLLGGGATRDVVKDYFGTELSHTPENQARMASHSVGPPSGIVTVIRMLRGVLRWVPAYGAGLAVRRQP
jgi:hypothetical protein